MLLGVGREERARGVRAYWVDRFMGAEVVLAEMLWEGGTGHAVLIQITRVPVEVFKPLVGVVSAKRFEHLRKGRGGKSATRAHSLIIFLEHLK